MSAVARDVLQIVKSPEVEIDALAVLEWSRSQYAIDGLVRLRAEGGEQLARRCIAGWPPAAGASPHPWLRCWRASASATWCRWVWWADCSPTPQHPTPSPSGCSSAATTSKD